MLSLVSTLFAAILSVTLTETALTGVVTSLRFKTRYLWFIGGILTFQAILILIIWEIRKRNRHILALKQHLVDVYLAHVENSKLNPNHIPQSNYDESITAKNNHGIFNVGYQISGIR